MQMVEKCSASKELDLLPCSHRPVVGTYPEQIHILLTSSKLVFLRFTLTVPSIYA